MLKEYLSHRLIGTSFEGPALQVRRAIVAWNQFRHPELREIFVESLRMKQVMERAIQPTMNCIDIGCHLGSMLYQMKRLAPHGTHLGVEPVPYKAKWLQQKFPDLEILPIALSDRPGEAEFFVQTRSSAYSGLRLQQAGTHDVTTFKVMCKRLDDIVPLDRPIGFIKLDAEGGELDVLRSGEALLNRDRPLIMFTCTQSALQAFEINPKQVFDAFTDRYGYSLFTLKGWLMQESPLTITDFVKAMQYPFQAFRFLAVPRRPN